MTYAQLLAQVRRELANMGLDPDDFMYVRTPELRPTHYDAAFRRFMAQAMGKEA